MLQESAWSISQNEVFQNQKILDVKCFSAQIDGLQEDGHMHSDRVEIDKEDS